MPTVTLTAVPITGPGGIPWRGVFFSWDGESTGTIVQGRGPDYDITFRDQTNNLVGDLLFTPGEYAYKVSLDNGVTWSDELSVAF